MPTLINNLGELTNEQFVRVDGNELPSEGNLLLSVEQWQANREQLSGRTIGVWLKSDEFAEQIAADLEKLALVAIEFPKFADGRGYSTARLLRERYQFAGPVRAIGDVLLDQLQYMHRCGFDQFELRDDQKVENAVKTLNYFSEAYQTSVERPDPLFRRRA
ncbi:DUF934 domain-containing protein [Salinibius halmophilus]|uniref:DUF934 domain-containing protein n=1 Tax=Salinibius halmophilus TaxID=1853216 RepID=UPI000E665024|nr:DUF934 domain-containing protein [Salinibius halmophilus]